MKSVLVRDDIIIIIITRIIINNILLNRIESMYEYNDYKLLLLCYVVVNLLGVFHCCFLRYLDILLQLVRYLFYHLLSLLFVVHHF